jgi:hypothetical protein
MLSRFYVHEKEHPQELQALAAAAVGMMASVIKPLGVTLTTLPVGNRLPGLTAGPSFELQNREYILPHRREAFMVLEERLLELADACGIVGDEAPTDTASTQLKTLKGTLQELGSGLRPAAIRA